MASNEKRTLEMPVNANLIANTVRNKTDRQITPETASERRALPYDLRCAKQNQEVVLELYGRFLGPK